MGYPAWARHSARCRCEQGPWAAQFPCETPKTVQVWNAAVEGLRLAQDLHPPLLRPLWCGRSVVRGGRRPPTTVAQQRQSGTIGTQGGNRMQTPPPPPPPTGGGLWPTVSCQRYRPQESMGTKGARRKILSILHPNPGGGGGAAGPGPCMRHPPAPPPPPPSGAGAMAPMAPNFLSHA